LVCNSCGHDNPRENRYCGMCGVPFPHRPLTVPDAQSTLTFNSAPLEIVPSQLPVRAAELPRRAGPRVSGQAYEAPPAPPDSQLIEPPPAPVVLLPPIAEEVEPIVAAESAVAAPPESQPIEPPSAPVVSLPPIAEEVEPIVAAELAVAAPPESQPIEPPPAPAVPPPQFVEEVEPIVAAESAPSAAEVPAAATPPPVAVPRVELVPVVEVEEPMTPPPVATAPVIERQPVAEVAKPATAPTEIPVEVPAPEPSLVRADRAPVPTAPHPPLDARTAPAVEAPTPPPVAAEPASIVFAPPEVSTPLPVDAEPAPPLPAVTREEVSRPTLPPQPEIRKFAPPHREKPPARAGARTSERSVIQKPSAQQPTDTPPASAGMPTFQSVAEASGTPVVSPFEPPVEKDPDDERELREFVASFRYHPPEESMDELTMRSEVPVLDAEAPATPSHPSFDDDVPPPPEAGPHPTGEEYYPPMDASADRSRFLEIRDARQAEPGHRTSTSTNNSFLGLDDSPPDTSPLLDQVAPTAPRRWLLWSALAALVATFGVLGFFEGRTEMSHAYQRPIEIIREQYAKLRQRASEVTTSVPARTTGTQVTEAPAAADAQAKSASADRSAATASKAEPESSANANPAASAAAPPATTPDQQHSTSSAATPQPTPATDRKAATSPSAPPAAVTPKPKSKPAPGQQELAQAMQANDPTAAAAWLWKATSRGNPEAPVRLADMYIKGTGVPRSCEQALVLLRSQVAKENAPARNRLAALYANGTCVARDRVKAYQLMSSALAVDPTSEWAEQNRKELLQQMTPEERSQAEKYH